MRHLHRIIIFLIFRLWVVVGVGTILSCSDGQGFKPESGETQPPPIWSSLVQGIVNWWPDAFYVHRAGRCALCRRDQ